MKPKIPFIVAFVLMMSLVVTKANAESYLISSGVCDDSRGQVHLAIYGLAFLLRFDALKPGRAVYVYNDLHRAGIQEYGIGTAELNRPAAGQLSGVFASLSTPITQRLTFALNRLSQGEATLIRYTENQSGPALIVNDCRDARLTVLP